MAQDYISIFTGQQIDDLLTKVNTPDSEPRTGSQAFVVSDGIKRALNNVASQADVDAILEMLPSSASESNKLATKEDVDEVVDMLDAGYIFVGVATPTTNPGIPTQKVFYFAAPGTYQHFSNTTVPNGSVGIFFYNNGWSYVVKPILELVNDLTTGGADKALTAEMGKALNEMINGETEYREEALTLTAGNYYAYNSGSDVPIMSDTPASREGVSCARIRCNPGDKFKIFGRGTNVVRLYAFTNSNREVLDSTGMVDVRNEGLEITAPVGSYYLYINFYLYDATLDHLQELVVLSEGVQEKIDVLYLTKVDKEEGKSLIDDDIADYFKEISSGDYARVTTDSQEKVLEGIKVMPDGRAVKHIPIDIETQDRDYSMTANGEFIELKTDAAGRIIEGVKSTGEKHISKFDRETLNYLEEQIAPSIPSTNFSIANLDANFFSPVPYQVTGEKGASSASYAFELPLEKAYNIRFKFRITEDIINQNKSCVIASINGVDVAANVVPITACQTQETYEGAEQTVKWPATDGGIAFNANTIDRKFGKRNIGGQAFSVKYLGESEAYLENNGSAIILTIGGAETRYPFSTYPTVSELYAAMSGNTNIALQFVALDQRNCSELLVFPKVPLRATFYCNDDGGYGGPKEVHVDSAPFFLNYAVEQKWHQVEIVRIGHEIFCCCEGIVTSVVASNSNDNVLTLGGACGVLFKDMEVHSDSSADAEVVDGIVISSANPYIAILMVHGMMNYPAYMALDVPPAPSSEIDRMNVDTMDYILSYTRAKGYLPVSVKDIAEYYTAGTPLPKRCYTLVFDDVRWQECLDLDFRRVFSRFGAKPALAMITNRYDTTTHNGVTITNKEATDICHAVGWDVVTHTSTHRSTYNLKPSQYEEYLRQDLYNADAIHADGSIYVYPGGETDPYMLDVLDYLGFKCAMCVDSAPTQSNMKRNRFTLYRINVSRVTRNGAFVDYNNQFIKKIR